MLRVVKLPVVAGACLIAGVLIGAALTPVLAQQMSGADGQVAVRSDYAVYLITGGQRRWVSTVMITDQEINAYPEGEPIFTGLAPANGQVASSGPPTVTPTPYQPPTSTPMPVPPVNQNPPGNPPPYQNPNQPSGNPPPYQPPPNPPATLPPHLSNQQPPGPLPSGSVGSSGSGSGSSGYPYPTPIGGGYYPTPTPYGGAYYATPTPTPYVYNSDPNQPYSEIDPNLPLDVSFEGSTTIERGSTLRVTLRTRPNAQCELTVRWPDGNEAQQSGRSADGQGRCEYSMRVGGSAPTGVGLVRATVRDAGYQSRQGTQFYVVNSL